MDLQREGGKVLRSTYNYIRSRALKEFLEEAKRHSFQAPIGPDISGPHLVAAVVNAGALGFLKAPDSELPDCLRELIKTTRTLTDKPFGVGVVLAFPFQENLKVILNEKVAVLQVSWGNCTKELVNKTHSTGVKVVPRVGNIEGAKQEIEAGVDGIIVQGLEVGGHVIGQVSDQESVSTNGTISQREERCG
ncbi:hypothetical protein Fmac_020435 [Flemingia macrophylla]|uniref:Uncharacterized protein n=1 Tax=Flemingia macrophylla TaxID=520843 RepID=A0ABD1LU30_9FABA